MINPSLEEDLAADGEPEKEFNPGIAEQISQIRINPEETRSFQFMTVDQASDRLRPPSPHEVGRAGRRRYIVNMPDPPEHLKERIEYLVNHHATQQWRRLEEVSITWRGPFGYLIAWDGFLPGMNEQIKLCRIEYLGDDDEWGFAIYDPATKTYAPSRLTTGRDTGHPTQAVDTAGSIHLAGYTS